MTAKTYILPAIEMSEGDGVDVHRLFPVTKDRMNYDPFVLWDDFNIGPAQGFPTHPHRGFEGITYMFSGSIEHKDNLGNKSTVTVGGVQRFTAGRGIEHSEMPDSKINSKGIQLWVNLAKSKKQIEPAYQQVDRENIPLANIGDGTIRTIIGKGSPVTLETPVRYLDISLDENSEYEEVIPPNFRGFVYLLSGILLINNEVLNNKEAYFYEGIDKLKITANEQSHFMLCMGQPHREPINQHGPYVD